MSRNEESEGRVVDAMTVSLASDKQNVSLSVYPSESDFVGSATIEDRQASHIIASSDFNERDKHLDGLLNVNLCPVIYCCDKSSSRTAPNTRMASAL